MDNLFGYIERITFQNSENGFTVAKLKQPNKTELVTVVGRFPSLQPGENVRCLGEWKRNAAYGIQFEVKEFQIEIPCDLIGIQKYLESGLIKGIGPAFAEKIVKKFGLETLKIIDSEPHRLTEVPGIGEKKIDKIKECWNAQKSIRELILYLQKYDISATLAHKLYKTYKDESIAKVQENPFRLAREVAGIGFKTADEIAGKMGYKKEASSRIDAGIEYVLYQFAEEGHVCYPVLLFLEEAKKVLEVDIPLIEERIAFLIEENRLVKEKMEDQDFLFLKGLYLCECGIQREIERIKTSPSNLRSVDMEKAIEWVEKTLYLFLAPMQREAVEKSLIEKVHIITGGPGTGKSTITKAICAITGKLSPKILLAAPTGKAADRLSEITKKEASTIHSLLQYDFKTRGFKRNRDNPLNCDLIIIDEASMIDTSLMYHLLKAVPDNARLIFVGDINQLPSIGPGNVLKEMIESQTMPTTILKEIFRQAKGSNIITNAHRINQGRFPEIQSNNESDFHFHRAETPNEALEIIHNLVCKELPQKFHFDPFNGIQVLTPMKKGIIGTENLNATLKEALNPSLDPLNYRGTLFSENDKVMQIRNNYQKEVFNGDIGRISKIDKEEQEVLITFGKKEVPYSFLELDEIVLAYACSVHKFQGSESPCVVIPVHTTHYVMLFKNLIYTAITRGKKLVVVVGTPKALSIAISNDKIKTRYTGLKHKFLNIDPSVKLVYNP